MTSYDVAVVGAGIVGLACAWAAERRGMSVLVVDRDEPGSGASGVAAGMLAPVTEAEFGEEALLQLNLEAARHWPAFAARLSERSGLDTGYRESGALVVAADRDDVGELRRRRDCGGVLEGRPRLAGRSAGASRQGPDRAPARHAAGRANRAHAALLRGAARERRGGDRGDRRGTRLRHARDRRRRLPAA